MKTITQAEIDRRIALHGLWLADDPSGARLVLRGCNMRNCDITGCDMAGSNMRGCDMAGSNMRGCDMGGCIGFILLPVQDNRGYSFIHAILCDDQQWRIRAGCRFFTINEARAHWGNPNYPDRERGDDYLYAVDWLERKLNRE